MAGAVCDIALATIGAHVAVQRFFAFVVLEVEERFSYFEAVAATAEVDGIVSYAELRLVVVEEIFVL